MSEQSQPPQSESIYKVDNVVEKLNLQDQTRKQPRSHSINDSPGLKEVRANLTALISGGTEEELKEDRQPTNKVELPEWAIPEKITAQSKQEHKESESSKMGFSLNSDNATNEALLDDEKTKLAATVFRNIIANPSLLDTMPSDLMLKYEEEELNEIDQARFEAWCKAVGFETVEQVYTRIPNATLQQLITFSPRLADLYKLEDEGRKQLATTLEVLQFVRDEAVHLQEAIAKSHEYLEKYRPEWLPHEPVEIVPQYGSLQQDSAYYGKVRGKHYIAYNVTNSTGEYKNETSAYEIPYYNPYRGVNKPTREHGIITMLHERVHQAHAETQETQEDFLGYDSDTFFSDEELEHFTPTDIITRIVERVYKPPDDESPIVETNKDVSDLARAFAEGVAVSAELDIDDKLIREAEEQGNMELAEEYRKVKKWRLGLLGREYRKAKSEGVCGNDPYSIGTLQLMRGLVSQFGVDHISDVAKRVSMKDCRKIKSNNPEFPLIVSNPSHLPGITITI